ncbi:MAG: hypothetical protein SH847_02210, partial [Roseiflexaceae bacterium]|nr:hypothetical protein [Roseiflexaceae bacterium]
MRSLRNRLTITYILVALLAVAVVAGLATFLIQRGFDSLADRQAQLEASDAAERLAEEGCRVAVLDWNGPSAEATVDHILKAGGEAIAIATDVSDES